MRLPLLHNFFRKRSRGYEIDPDEILLDAENLPAFDRERFEGRLERPLGQRTILVFAIFCLWGAFLLVGKTYALQVVNGDFYSKQSENNRLEHTLVFGERGRIIDRNDVVLAENEIKEGEGFSKRRYIDLPGLAHVVGYVSYPKKDSAGFYWEESVVGKDGAEKAFDEILSGTTGLKIIETDVAGNVKSESVFKPPQNGKDIKLSIDSSLNSAFWGYLKDLSEQNGFTGGGGVIMDIRTGELLSLTSFPEYNSQILTDGKDSQKISGYLKNERMPFLDRVVSGLYAPGSIVKPFLALGALEEKLISPEREIVSKGSIEVPNPYALGEKSVFLDWKAHGPVDMKKALAISSNVYFYSIGGGYENQKGLGINNIEKYMRLFGFGAASGIDLPNEEEGVIPNPSWKAKNFGGEAWRLGDTYHTAIGQYGFQVTPIQAVRGVAALGNGGYLLTPSILSGISENSPKKLLISKENLNTILLGMREAVREGTATGLDIPQVPILAKTGTAEVGITKKSVNSWVIGLFPYPEPRYAFAVIMEKGPRENTVGALYVMRQVLEWMAIYRPEYLK